MRMGSLTQVVATLLALGLGVLSWQYLPIQSRPGEQLAQLGLAAAPKGGDFVLQSADGPIDLKELRGKLVILYFGYTWCPDVCPTSLSLLVAALNAMSPEEVARLQVLFISVDPERDTPERLKEYVGYFHPAITGVTGSPERLREIAANYGAAFQKVQQEQSEVGYLVDHSASFHLVDAEGRFIGTVAHGTPSGQILEKIRKQLETQEGGK